jgi:hypothetical protein
MVHDFKLLSLWGDALLLIVELGNAHWSEGTWLAVLESLI